MGLRVGWLVLTTSVVLAAWACGGSDSSGDSNGVTPDGGSTDATIDDGSANDSGGATDGTAPAFTPATLGSRLVLWLDAAQGILLEDAGRDAAVVVSAWADQSGNHNDAIQDSGLRAPFFLSGASDASVNGKPLVTFKGNEFAVVSESPSLVWGTGDFALYIVFRYKNPASMYAFAVGKYDPNVGNPGPNVFANYFAPAGTVIVGRVDHNDFVGTQDGGYNDNKIHVAGLRRAGSTIELRVDGVSTSNDDAGLPDGSPIDVSAPGFPVMIGDRTQMDAPLNGGIAEIVGVKGALTPAEIDALESYFRSKYAL